VYYSTRKSERDESESPPRYLVFLEIIGHGPEPGLTILYLENSQEFIDILTKRPDPGPFFEEPVHQCRFISPFHPPGDPQHLSAAFFRRGIVIKTQLNPGILLELAINLLHPAGVKEKTGVIRTPHQEIPDPGLITVGGSYGTYRVLVGKFGTILKRHPLFSVIIDDSVE